MSKTIIIGGFGPGISSAVAERFGAEGFTAALVGRNPDRLAAGVAALGSRGVRAQAFPADLSKPAEIRAVVDAIRAAQPPIAALLWTAYTGGAGDLTVASPAEIMDVVGVAVAGLVTAIQAMLPDLIAERGTVLVANGGLGLFDPKIDAIGAEWNAMGLSVANSAKHKLVGVLGHKLAARGVYVGEIVVTGMIKGSAFADDRATIDPAAVAAKLWDLYRARSPRSVTM